ncbi:protein FAM228B isoform X5 [Passer montanus]|uniref:protein FAM228B isoform X5 n=1 Tax=Passer montanus TaxID=9160 RepID=UPI00195F4C24|nr:protein FAM228B isoform X5 [Passer montanus]
MGSVNNSEGPWLQRFANGKPVRKPKRQKPWRAAPDQSRDIIASAECILDRENFVRGYVFLDDYDPSEYDPFFQKTGTDGWKASAGWNSSTSTMTERGNDVTCTPADHSSKYSHQRYPLQNRLHALPKQVRTGQAGLWANCNKLTVLNM